MGSKNPTAWVIPGSALAGCYRQQAVGMGVGPNTPIWDGSVPTSVLTIQPNAHPGDHDWNQVQNSSSEFFKFNLSNFHCFPWWQFILFYKDLFLFESVLERRKHTHTHTHGGGMRKRGGSGNILHLLVHFPNSCSDLSRAAPEPGARRFLLVSRVSTGAHGLKPFSAVFLDG